MISATNLLMSSCVAALAVPARRVTIKLAAGILTVTFSFAAVGCAAAAIWIYEIPELGQAGAALAASGFFIILGLIVLGVAAWLLRTNKSYRVVHQSQALPLAEASQLFKNHKSTAIVGAVIAGMLLADSRRKH